MSSYLGEFLLHAAELNPIEMENTYLWENQDFVVFISKIGKLILRKPSLLAFGKDFHLWEHMEIFVLLNPSEKILSQTFLIV